MYFKKSDENILPDFDGHYVTKKTPIGPVGYIILGDLDKKYNKTILGGLIYGHEHNSPELLQHFAGTLYASSKTIKLCT